MLIRYIAMDDLTSVTNLHFAAQGGDVEAIARLVAAGADVNARNEHGNTPLKYASAEPLPAAIRKLIELGADVNFGDDRGFTPLPGAMRRRSPRRRIAGCGKTQSPPLSPM